MAIGERIRFIRNLRGMTQKSLGIAVGFSERTADVRIAQYESGTRTPRADLTAALASALDVSPKALDVSDLESNVGLMHLLFALEDLCGIKVTELDGEVCLRLEESAGGLSDRLLAWKGEADKLRQGDIGREEYDRWRYTYPRMELERANRRLMGYRDER